MTKSSTSSTTGRFVYFANDDILLDNREDILEVRKISTSRSRSWFTVDFISVLPLNFMLSTGSYNSLARIARIPKLYRLVKIAR